MQMTRIYVIGFQKVSFCRHYFF